LLPIVVVLIKRGRGTVATDVGSMGLLDVDMGRCVGVGPVVMIFGGSGCRIAPVTSPSASSIGGVNGSSTEFDALRIDFIL